MLNDYISDPLSNSVMIGKKFYMKHLSGRTKEECSLAFIAQKCEERDTVNDKTSAEKVIHTIEKTIPLAQNCIQVG